MLIVSIHQQWHACGDHTWRESWAILILLGSTMKTSASNCCKLQGNRKIIINIFVTWYPSVCLQKKITDKEIMILIYMRTIERPHQNNFFVSLRTCEKIEVKWDLLVKRWEFGQTEKSFYLSIFQHYNMCFYELWTIFTSNLSYV